MSFDPAQLDKVDALFAGEVAYQESDRRAVGSREQLREALHRAGALSLLILLSPLLLVVAVLVRLSSAGPAFFYQQRTGLGGRPFRMLKFRTMKRGAEEQEAGLDDDGSFFFKVERDERVTPFGAWLRRTSLDELPQLINVVRGEMRLVGPRPLLLLERDKLSAEVCRWRFSIKPGITGLWQVSGRSRLTDSSRLRLDRLQVERDSLGLDLLVLVRTPSAVLRCDGAN
jgi:lipopolysaccharide/colanic/teichoic acid biosynthesis glycosyltransferase